LIYYCLGEATAVCLSYCTQAMQQLQTAAALILAGCYSWKHCFTSTIFFPMMTPVPSPCPTKAQYGTVCKISPPYVAQFRSLTV